MNPISVATMEQYIEKSFPVLKDMLSNDSRYYDDMYDILPKEYDNLSLIQKRKIVKTIMSEINDRAHEYANKYNWDEIFDKIMNYTVDNKKNGMLRYKYVTIQSIYDNTITNICSKILSGTVTDDDYNKMFEEIMISGFCCGFINYSYGGDKTIYMSSINGHNLRKLNDSVLAFFLLSYMSSDPIYDKFECQYRKHDSNGYLELIKWDIILNYFSLNFTKTLKVILGKKEHSYEIFKGITRHLTIDCVTNNYKCIIHPINYLECAQTGILKQFAKLLVTQLKAYYTGDDKSIYYLGYISILFCYILVYSTDENIKAVLEVIPDELMIIILLFGISKPGVNHYANGIFGSPYPKTYLIDNNNTKYALHIVDRFCGKIIKNNLSKKEIVSEKTDNTIKVLESYIPSCIVLEDDETSRLINIFGKVHFDLLSYSSTKIMTNILFDVTPDIKDILFYKEMISYFDNYFDNVINVTDPHVYDCEDRMKNLPSIQAIINSQYPELIYLIGYMSNPTLSLKENKAARNKYFDAVNNFRDCMCSYDASDANYVPVSKNVFDDFLKWNATGMLEYFIMNNTNTYTLSDAVDFIRIMKIDNTFYDTYIAAMFYRATTKGDVNIRSLQDAYEICTKMKFKYLYWVMTKYIFEHNIKF